LTRPRSIDTGSRSLATAISSREPPQVIAGTGTPTLQGRRLRFALTPWTAVCVIFGLFAVLLFAYHGLRYADETQSELRLIPWLRYDVREDFNYFYAGADMVWHGDAADLYPEPGARIYYPREPIFAEPRPEYENARLLARGGYYYPPALAFLQAPLTALSFRDAYWILTSISLTCLLVYVAIAWRQGRQIGETPFLILGVLAFRPVHEVLILGHITCILLVALLAGFLLLRADKPLLAGLAFSLLAFKPQWAILPAIFLVIRGEWRALGSMTAAGAAIFFVPFFFTSWHTFNNYYEFVRYLADVNLKDAPHMFSWNGLLTKLDDSEVQPDGSILFYADAPSRTLVYALIALSVLPLLVVWWSRDFLMGVAATVLAMLLVSTHSVWYDWSMLAVAALFLVLAFENRSRGRRVEMWVVLLALYLAAGHSIGEVLVPDRHEVDWHRSAFYWITPVALVSLFWMASIVLRDRFLTPGQSAPAGA
jgi:alpha-1,2-mannosyltransferase